MALQPEPRSGRRRLAALGLAALLVVTGGTTLAAFGVSALREPTLPAAATGGTGAGPATPAPGRPASPAPPSASPAPPSAPSADPPSPTTRPGPVPFDARDIALRTRLSTALEEIRGRLGIPGLSVTIILADGGTWTGASGDADVDGRVPVTPDTAFALASISKTYTAALVLDLVADGRVDLDEPVRTYLPEAAIDRRITVRQLLDHTSGLYDYFLSPRIDRALLAQRDASWSIRRTLKYVGRPYFPPGKGWHYSNTNYLYLGLLAERLTGQSLAVALRDRLLDPLGLERTWFQAVERPRAELAHGYRFAAPRLSSPPIDLSDGTAVAPFTSVITAAAGAGAIAATSADVARWARLLYTGQVLGPATTALMLDGVAATAAYKPRIPYGLGVQAFPIGGRPAVGHSGRLLGFRTAVRHLPGPGVTIAVLTNQSRADPAIVVEELLGIVFAVRPVCPRCAIPA